MTAANGSNGSNGSAPKPREEWIARRKAEAAKSGDDNFSQMHFARKGQVTEEMIFIAERDKLTPEVVREEVAAGRMIIPAKINHRVVAPMAIVEAALLRIKAQVGTHA